MSRKNLKTYICVSLDFLTQNFKILEVKKDIDNISSIGVSYVFIFLFETVWYSKVLKWRRYRALSIT